VYILKIHSPAWRRKFKKLSFFLILC
jgi:hypothetical protein